MTWYNSEQFQLPVCIFCLDFNNLFQRHRLLWTSSEVSSYRPFSKLKIKSVYFFITVTRIFSELHPKTSVGQTGSIWSENGLTISSKRQRYVAQVEQRSPAGLMGGGAASCRGQMEESKLITTQPLIPFQPIVSIFVQILGQLNTSTKNPACSPPPPVSPRPTNLRSLSPPRARGK